MHTPRPTCTPATPPPLRLRAMQVQDLDAVLAIEVRCYSHPWTRGNFVDSLAAGHLMQVLQEVPGPHGGAGRSGALEDPQQPGHQGPALIGYLVAMPGPDEMHLLNLSVAPDRQGQGHGRALLAELCRHARALSARQLWLEVRQTNHRAAELYRAFGFQRVGVRPRYYPAANGREDAVVMCLDLLPGQAASAAAAAAGSVALPSQSATPRQTASPQPGHRPGSPRSPHALD